MEYNVEAIPKDEFLHYVDLVDRSMKSRRSDVKSPKLEINRVTDDYKEFDPFATPAKIRNNTTVGQAWGIFKRIWIKPGRGMAEMRVTAIHEIAHLAEANQAHGPKWRRVFCVAHAYHLREQGVPEEAIQKAILATVTRYRKWREYTPQGHYNPWSEYCKKAMAEADSIYKASLKG